MQPISKIAKKSRQATEAIQRDQHRRALLVNGVQLLFAINVGTVLFFNIGWQKLELHKYPILLLFAAYGVFWLWTLHRGMNERLKWYDITISTALDFTLCMELLLFQYANSEGSLGVAPMFSYVFLLIAARSLHFQPAYIWLAGAFATIGWSALVAITLIANGMTVTFSKELTLQEVLFSGVFERFFAIFGVTCVLAYSVKQSKKYFEAAIVRSLAGKGLAKFIGHEIANKIVMADGDIKPGQGRMVRAAIIMVDLRSFTKIASTLKPSAVMKLLQDYQSLIAPIISDRGGIIDKFMGDGILAHFGAVNTSTTYAADALVAIEEILFKAEHWQNERIQQGQPPIEVRAACAIGDIIFGTVGSGARMEFTIIGDAVNTTAKLEKHTKVLGVKALVTARAFDTAKSQGYMPQSRADRYNNIVIPGLSRPVDLVAISEPAGASFAHLLPTTKAS